MKEIRNVMFLMRISVSLQELFFFYHKFKCKNEIQEKPSMIRCPLLTKAQCDITLYSLWNLELKLMWLALNLVDYGDGLGGFLLRQSWERGSHVPSVHGVCGVSCQEKQGNTNEISSWCHKNNRRAHPQQEALLMTEEGVSEMEKWGSGNRNLGNLITADWICDLALDCWPSWGDWNCPLNDPDF